MKILCVLATIIAVVLVPITAQAQDRLQFRVNIPFDFVAGGVHMGSGNYLAFHVTPMILNLVREDGKGSTWVKVMPSPVITNNVYCVHPRLSCSALLWQHLLNKNLGFVAVKTGIPQV